MKYGDNRATAGGLAALLMAASASGALGAVISYPAGSTRTTPIVLIDNSTQLEVVSGAATQAGIISEAGGSFGLEKIGFGRLILTADNTYTGQTRVSQSILQLGDGGTTGSILGNVVLGDAELQFNRSDTYTFTGNVSSGNTSLVRQAGSGTTILNGSVQAHLQVDAGTLRRGVTGSLASFAVLRVNGGTFDLNGANQTMSAIFGTGGTIALGAGSLTLDGVRSPRTYAGIITGAGSLALASGSNSTLTLTGANSYTGGTTINTTGTLQIGDGGASGAVAGDIVNNGALIFNRSNNYNYAGIISGSGSVIKTGGGSLMLSTLNTYTGTTTVSAGSLLLVNTTSGFALSRNFIDNATIQLEGNGMIYSGVISGSGGVIITRGSLSFTGDNTFAGQTAISDSVVTIGNGGTSGSVAGNILISRADLRINRSDTLTIAGNVSASAVSGLHQVGSGITILQSTTGFQGALDVSAGTLRLGSSAVLGTNTLIQVTDGAFDLNGTTQTISEILGTGGTIALGSGALTLTGAVNTRTYSGVITGSGSLSMTGGSNGTLILNGANTYTGGTTLGAGTLRLGAGGSLASTGALTVNAGIFDLNGRSQAVGALSGTGGEIRLGAAVLTTVSASDTTLASVITGTGSFAKGGAGILTLTGTHSFTGGTTVSGGTLRVNGAIGAVTVASGATLGGTGTTGTVTVQSGGTLAPGASIGTLAINGNLALTSGSVFAAEISPAASDLAAVTGGVSLGGTAAISASAGTYAINRRYTLLNATGGVSGTFAALTASGLPSGIRPRLSYDAGNVYLNLDPSALTPQLPPGASANQLAVAAAIDAAIQSGASAGGGFLTLYGLSGAQLQSALDQISGPLEAGKASAIGQNFLNFLASGGSGNPVSGKRPAQLMGWNMRVWGGGYGGHIGFSADAASGAASLSGNNAGFIGGADFEAGEGLRLGAGLAVGHQDFLSGNGMGESDDVLLGLNGEQTFGDAYVALSAAYGWHDLSTRRAITVSGTDVLQGQQDAETYGARLEGGWRLPLDEAVSLVPYAAFAVGHVESPAYTETAAYGASTFALSYAAHGMTLARQELGSRLETRFGLEGGTIALGLKAAWSHRYDDAAFAQAAFAALPGFAFQAAGVQAAKDAALFGGSIEFENVQGFMMALQGSVEAASGSTIAEGVGRLGWRW